MPGRWALPPHLTDLGLQIRQGTGAGEASPPIISQPGGSKFSPGKPLLKQRVAPEMQSRGKGDVLCPCRYAQEADGEKPLVKTPAARAP